MTTSFKINMPTSDPSNSRLPNFDGNRVQGLSNIQTIEQSQSISSIILNIVNIIIFAISGISVVLLIGSLVTGIILTATKNKSAKVAWIICGVSACVIFLCIITFILLTVIFNIASNLDISSY